MFKKIKDYITCILFSKQIMQTALNRCSDNEIRADNIETLTGMNAQTYTNLQKTLEHFNYSFIYLVMEFFAKDLNHPIQKMNIKNINSLKYFCEEQLLDCYKNGEEKQTNYFIEVFRFIFRYDYNYKDFSIEYVIEESGKNY